MPDDLDDTAGRFPADLPGDATPYPDADPEQQHDDPPPPARYPSAAQTPPPPPPYPPAAHTPPPYPSSPYESGPPAAPQFPRDSPTPPAPPPGFGRPYGAPLPGEGWRSPPRPPGSSPEWYPGSPGGFAGPGRLGHPPGLATYGVRLGGWLIDWLILSIVGAVVLVPLHAVTTTQTSGTGRSSVSVSSQGIALSALIVVTYGTAFIGSRRGQTLGMMAMRARAVDMATGGPIGYGRAFGRALFEYVLLFLFVFPWVIDMLFPLWDGRRQTLHDKVTNTVVVRT